MTGLPWMSAMPVIAANGATPISAPALIDDERLLDAVRVT
jgi:hypothetical protein